MGEDGRGKAGTASRREALKVKESSGRTGEERMGGDWNGRKGLDRIGEDGTGAAGVEWRGVDFIKTGEAPCSG